MNVKSFLKKTLAAALALALCVPVVMNVMKVRAAGEELDVYVSFYKPGEVHDEYVENASAGEELKVTVLAQAVSGGSPADGDIQITMVSHTWSGNETVITDLTQKNNGYFEGTIKVPDAVTGDLSLDVAFDWSVDGVSKERVTKSGSLEVIGGGGSSSSSGGESSSSSEETVSGNVPSSSSSSAPASEPAPAEAPANSVNVGGRVVESTVGGVYTAKSVNGVAIAAPIADVAAAAGLSEADIANGTNVRFYVCDSRKREVKDALKGVADASGRRVVAYIDADMYTITKAGVVTNIRTTTAPVAMIFGLQGSLINEGHTYSVIALAPDGNAVVFNDMDTNNATITINANVFGTYAISINP